MNWTRRNLMAASAAFLFAVTALSQTTSPNIESIVKPCVDNEMTVGVAVGFLDANESHFYSYGKPSKDSAALVSEKTLFEIGSISKVFTSLLLADMVERGEMKLEDNISLYLPKGFTSPVRNGKSITLEHLATHFSGLPRIPPDLLAKDDANPYADFDATSLFKYLNAATLESDPGETWSYSNLAVGLLGQILSDKTGKSYEQLVREKICSPLGMSSTVQIIAPEWKARLAQGHSGGKPVSNWDFQSLAGCGALRSSAEDLLRFAAAHLNLERSPLKKEISCALKVRKSQGSPGKTQALGWMISKKKGDEIVHHGGGTGGYRSFVGYRPSAKTAVAILCNSEMDVSAIGMHLLDSTYELPIQRKTLPVDLKIYDDYLGRYQLGPGALFVITRDEKSLYAQITGQERYEIFPESEKKFFYRVVDAQISFERDPQGRVHRLILHQYGRDQLAARLDSKTEPARIAMDSKKLDAFVGSYKSEDGLTFAVTKENNSLWVQLPKQPKLEVLPMSELRFFYNTVLAEIEFHRDASGVIDALTLFQGGKEIEANKSTTKK